MSEASSLHYLAQWIKDAQNFAPNATRMLLGNKTDLEPEIDPTTSKSFASAHDFELQSVVSCKSNTGINEAFEQLAKALHNSQSAARTGGTQTQGDTIVPRDFNDSQSGDSSSSNCSC